MLFLLPLFLASSLAHRGNPTIVDTTSGLLRGHTASNRSEVTEFLGIRYAHAAVGELRFAPPMRYDLTEFFDASHYSPDCPANLAPISKYPPLTPHGATVLEKFLDQANNHTQSEDCLTLNIWSKSPIRKRQLKAVLVFLHGGRFQIPGSNSPFYNGQYLADAEDIVVVTVNYRVVIFGASGAPGLTQNVGLLDQRSAVEWVRDNIAGFGGDPAKITLWGHSVSGFSVDNWAYAFKDDTIVHGLIADSGVAFNVTPTWPGESAQFFYNVAGEAGCTDTATAVACMRQKSFQDILKAQSMVKATHLYQRVALPIFRPIADNETVFNDYVGLARNGSFAHIPLLVGNNNHESGFYRVTAYAANISMTEVGWRQWEDVDFTCPTYFEAYQRRRHNVSTWVYRYFGDWPNLQLYNTSGAYHGTELDMVFGTAQDVAGGVPNTPAEDRTIQRMMRAWAAFAKDPHHGLERLGWPKFDPEGPTLVRLGYDNTSEVSFVTPSVYGQNCPPYSDPTPNYGQPPFF